MTRSTTLDIEARWRRASQLLALSADVLAERPSVEPPGWAIERGWADFLAGLDDSTVTRCEIDGLAAHADALGAPTDLRALVFEGADVCRLPALAGGGRRAPTHRVKARKRRQIAAFAAAVADLPARRVVDVGAGHGHLTRHLVDALGIEGLGVEREPALVETARSLAARADARFEAADLFTAPPTLTADDLVVGLHACGALTDRLVVQAAEAGAAVAYASCCLQKRPEPARRPLVTDGPLGEQALPRATLGLANIHLGPRGVEASHAENVAARARRAGLRALLQGRGLTLAPGDEMHGVNRRRAHDTFADFVAFALARRGLPPAPAAELSHFEALGRAQSAADRRWSLARHWLGRVVEIQVNCDRALYLERRGYRVALGALWPLEVSPRNVGVIGRCESSRASRLHERGARRKLDSPTNCKMM